MPITKILNELTMIGHFSMRSVGQIDFEIGIVAITLKFVWSKYQLRKDVLKFEFASIH